MAPSFTLKGFSSPARASLSLALPPASSPKVGSPLASPVSPSARSQAPSPAASRNSGKGYFDVPTPAVERSEALKTVKVVENMLASWNEYRQALTTLSKASRKFGGSIKDLTALLDKTDVSAQTLRPVAAVLEGSSDITAKLAKRVDREYDEANADASKYFNLLAKETRSQDAYVASMTKRHEKAEKAFRKASKSMSDASTAHVGLQSLRDSIGEDMVRANQQHATLIGSKQTAVILRLAASSGMLASSLVSFFSESLKKAGSASRDIEYFRTLADIAWQGVLPPDLAEAELEEEKRREELRVIKTRVAMGELDLIGPGYWAGSQKDRSATLTKTRPDGSPSNAQALTEPTTNAEHLSRASSGVEPVLGLRPDEKSHTVDLDKPPHQEEVFARSRHVDTTHQIGPTKARQSDSLFGSSSSTLSNESASSTDWTHGPEHHRDGPRPAPPVIPRRSESHESESAHSSRSSVQARALRFDNHDEVIAPRSNHTARTSSISIPGVKRSVSQIAADLQSRAENERVAAFEAHKLHCAGFQRDCHLCSMDYDRMLRTQHAPPDLRSQRRQTLPPAYPSSSNAPPTPISSSDPRFPGHVPTHTDFSPRFTPMNPLSTSLSGIASPRPRRGAEHRAGFEV